MLNIHLRKLRISQFRTFLDEAVLRLDLPGVTFLRGENKRNPRAGSNGSGKSTIWDALLWCLYGVTVDGLRNNDIRPWKGGKGQTVVELEFSINEQPHVLRRTAGPNSIKLDGRLIAQDAVDKLIVLPAKTWLHTVMLGQGQDLFLDIQPRDKMTVFSSVLNLERWAMRSSLASDRCRNIQDKLTYTRVSSQRANEHLKELTDLLAKSEEEEEAWERRAKKDRNELEATLEKLAQDANNLTKREAELALKVDSAGTEVSALQSTINGVLRQRLENANFALQTENAQKAAMEREAARLLMDVQELGSGVCPTCGQRTHKVNLKEQIGELKAKRNDLLAKIKKLPKTETQCAAQDNLDAMRRAERDLEIFARKESDARDASAELAHKISETKAEAKAIKKELQNLQYENPHRRMTAQLRRKQQNCKDEIKEMEDRCKVLARRLDRTHRWITGFRDIRLMQTENILTELTMATTALLEDVGLSGWSITYNMERETKEGTISSGLTTIITSPDQPDPVKWTCYSGGEAQRLRLVGALALRDVLLRRAGVHVNLFVLDEPTRGLSNTGRDDLYEVLDAYAEHSNSSVWFIDHAVIETSCFRNTRTVIRTRFGSHIERKT